MRSRLVPRSRTATQISTRCLKSHSLVIENNSPAGEGLVRIRYHLNQPVTQPGIVSTQDGDLDISSFTSSTALRRAFSGIQPTGIPHLGNYLGALRPWKDLHDEVSNRESQKCQQYEQYFSVVDLHALTSTTPAKDFAQQRKETFAALLATGIWNNKHTTLFMQSDVPQHASMMWMLSTIASTGYLSRMTQWKSKLHLSEDANLDSDEATAKLKLGLFSYPVLQAADILLYQPTVVPVGEDQLQHIEFARVLARAFNAHVRRDVFAIPAPQICE
jgi:tryptophanyl-tRNA synthetase